MLQRLKQLAFLIEFLQSMALSYTPLFTHTFLNNLYDYNPIPGWPPFSQCIGM